MADAGTYGLISPLVGGDRILVVRAGVLQNVLASQFFFHNATGAYPSLTIARSDSSTEGGQVSFNRASDDANTWSIDVQGAGTSDRLRLFDTSERLVIDHSGNINIGSGLGSAGAVLDLQRTSTTSVDMKLRNASVTTSLFSDSANSFLGSPTNNNLYFFTNNVSRWIVLNSGHLTPFADNVYDLGSGSFRARVLYAATGTINTSDERDKTWRGELSDAEYEVGLKVIKELGFFQWNDAIEEKGEADARIHFGIRAQKVWGLFADVGLVDPINEGGTPGKTPYAFLCWDSWEDQYTNGYEDVTTITQVPTITISPNILGPDGSPLKTTTYEEVERVDRVETGEQVLVKEAGHRYGIRPDQLALFLISVMSRRMEVEASEDKGEE